MRLRFTLGLAILVTAVSVAAVVAGTRNTSSNPAQPSTQVSHAAAIPDAFERAVNRARTLPPDVVDRAMVQRRGYGDFELGLDPAIAAAMRAHH
jgi:hypothetical protein